MKRKVHLSKAEQLELWRKRLEGVPSLVVFRYTGLKALQMSDLRRKAREAGCSVGIVKNTLLRRAVEGHAFAPLGEKLAGTLAVTLSGADPTSAARLMTKYVKDNEKCQIVGGMLASTWLEPAGIEQLADMPPLPVARATFLGLLAAAPSRFLGLLSAVPGSLVRVLAARKEALEKAA